MIKYNMMLIAIALSLISCAQTSHQPSYAEQLAQRPYPTSQQDINTECAWIRNEIARMQNSSAYLATSQFGMVAQMTARNNIAALESRAANLRCGAAFSSTHIIEKQNSSSAIDECIVACKRNTSRTSEQCFDACNK